MGKSGTEKDEAGFSIMNGILNYYENFLYLPCEPFLSVDTFIKESNGIFTAQKTFSWKFVFH